MISLNLRKAKDPKVRIQEKVARVKVCKNLFITFLTIFQIKKARSHLSPNQRTRRRIKIASLKRVLSPNQNLKSPVKRLVEEVVKGVFHQLIPLKFNPLFQITLNKICYQSFALNIKSR